MIVVGHVYTSEYEDRDGNRRSSLEVRATSVGPDLSRSIVRIIEKTSSLQGRRPGGRRARRSAETTDGDEAADDAVR